MGPNGIAPVEATYCTLFCLFNRTPTPPPLLGMNSIPASSSVILMSFKFAAVIDG